MVVVQQFRDRRAPRRVRALPALLLGVVLGTPVAAQNAPVQTAEGEQTEIILVAASRADLISIAYRLSLVADLHAKLLALQAAA